MSDFLKPVQRRSIARRQSRPAAQSLAFVITPPPHIRSDVAVLKDDVHYLLGHDFMDRYEKAGIPLFTYSDDHWEEMIQYVKNKTKQFKPFNVFIKNMNVMVQGKHRNIYLDIVNKYPFREMMEKMIREDIDYFPHLPLACHLSSEDFYKIWPSLKDVPYSQHFTCDRLTVLIRSERKWIKLQELFLEG